MFFLEKLVEYKQEYVNKEDKIKQKINPLLGKEKILILVHSQENLIVSLISDMTAFEAYHRIIFIIKDI